MIKPDRLTVKASEALQEAASLARAGGNPVINDAHLFLALLSQDEGIVVPLLQKAGLNVTQLAADTQREIERFPSNRGAPPSLRSHVSCPGCSTAPRRRQRASATRTCRPSTSCSPSLRRKERPPGSSCQPLVWIATTCSPPSRASAARIA